MKRLKGSMTIEAAIVLPTCLIGTMILLLFILVYHDYTVIKGYEHQVLETYCDLQPNYGYIYSSPIAIREKSSASKPILFIGESQRLSYSISVTDYMIFKKASVVVNCPINLLGRDLTYKHKSTQIVTSGTEVVRLISFFDDFTSDQVMLAQMKQYFDKAIEVIELAITK